MSILLNNMKYKLGFIGAGNMAEAIARAAVGQGVVPADQVIASDPTAARCDVFKSFGVTIAESNAQVIQQASSVMIAVKPQMVEVVIDDLANYGTDEHVIISIMAGIRSAKLNDMIEAAGGARLRLVRVMPNTPLMVGLGMAGIARGDGTSEGDDRLALDLFSAGNSKAITVEEDLIDAVSAVSGSGPAYVFYLAEAMEQAAVEMGLAEHAHVLTSQTILGAAKLMAESEDEPQELRRKVTSPKGTTEQAILHMDTQAMKQTIVDGMKKALARGRELGA
jgi:pyrroline-5-carboxylate reductase